MSLDITFWGTRGSIPTPGPSTVRYGGNTPCLTIDDGTSTVVLDAGTGARALGRSLESRARHGDLDIHWLLTHTHWDHIQGIPFFRPLYRAGTRIEIHGPPQRGTSLETILRRQMEASVFPVSLSAAHANLTVHEIVTTDFDVPGFKVSTIDVTHPAPTLGFSVTSDRSGKRATYITDNELGAVGGMRSREQLVRFLRTSDLLVHDAMYFESQMHERRGFGHSSANEAVQLALESECRHLALFHHDPDHDDRTLERLLAEACETRDRQGGALEITLAQEGTTMRLEG